MSEIIPTEIIIRLKGKTLLRLLKEANIKLKAFSIGTPFAKCGFICTKVKQLTNELAGKPDIWELSFEVFEKTEKTEKIGKTKETDRFLLSYLGRSN